MTYRHEIAGADVLVEVNCHLDAKQGGWRHRMSSGAGLEMMQLLVARLDAKAQVETAGASECLKRTNGG